MACYGAQAVRCKVEMGMAALAFGTSAHVAIGNSSGFDFQRLKYPQDERHSSYTDVQGHLGFLRAKLSCRIISSAHMTCVLTLNSEFTL